MTQFREYPNKNSVLKRYSRQIQGGQTDIFEERLGWWERRNDIPKDQIDDIEFLITTEFEGRPDKIAAQIYDRTDLEWVVLQYNNIVDINEEIVAGKTIQLPSAQRVFYEIAIRTVDRRRLPNV